MREKIFMMIWIPVVLFAQLGSLTKISVNTSKDRVIITLKLKGSYEKVKDFVLQSPDRIVVDLEGVKYVLGSNVFPINQGDVIRIRGSQYKIQPAVSRVVVDLKKPCNYKLVKNPGELKIEVETKPASVGMKRNFKSKRVLQRKSSSIETKSPKRSNAPEFSAGPKYFYSSRGKRDPFSNPAKIENPGDTLLEVAKARLIGVIKDASGYTALIEDAEGRGFILKKGDAVKNGHVIAVGENYVKFGINDFGFTRIVILKLEKEEVSR